MKIGVIFALYNCTDTLDECLKACAAIKNDSFVYHACVMPFKGYEGLNVEPDNTFTKLQGCVLMDCIDHGVEYVPETEDRGL